MDRRESASKRRIESIRVESSREIEKEYQ